MASFADKMIRFVLLAVFTICIANGQFFQQQHLQQNFQQFPVQFFQQSQLLAQQHLQSQQQKVQQDLLQTRFAPIFQPPKTGRSLEPPIPELCASRQIHETFNGKGYWFSWRDGPNSIERDWLDGRNFCRHRCMDLVSLETAAENDYIKTRIVEGQQRYIWTSGRLCDFKGCDNREDLRPLIINGWFWSGELRKLPPAVNRAQNDWSNSGGINRVQPDNREFQQGGAQESCLAILNNFYGDGVHWHDVACHHRKPIVCEDSEALLRYVRYTNPNLRV